MNYRDIQIDDDFQNALRPQNAEESAAMRASIDQFGYLQPLICWLKDSKTLILVDGHHRLLDYKRRLDEYSASPKGGMLGLLGKRVAPLPNPPDFLKLPFKDKEAVIEFIRTSQEGRRNLNEAELSLLRNKSYQEQKRNVPEGEAVRRAAEEHGVSVRTIRRDAIYANAIDLLKPIVADQTGKDLVKVATADDGPPKAAIVEAAKIIESPALTREMAQAAIQMATTPASKLRLDVAEDGKPKPPAWETKLMAFEAILEKIWSDEDTDADTKKAVRRRVKSMVAKFFPQMVAAPVSKSGPVSEAPKVEEATAW